MAIVLIVEDDRVSQKILTKVLRNAGHEALTATNLMEAGTLLRQHILVDLVILDSQLGNEWGWDFLRELRMDPIFRGIPVVVYTAHTERSLLVRYVELGVQNLRVKPYRGEVVLEEVARALKTGWAAGLLENISDVCSRLKVTPTDYCGLLNTAAPLIEQSLQDIRRRLTSVNDPMLHAQLENIKLRSTPLGIRIFSVIVDAAMEAIRNEEHVRAAAALRVIEPLLGILRKRAMGSLSMEDAIAPFHAPADTAPTTRIKPMAGPPASICIDFCRRVAATPIWRLGAHFTRLRGIPFITSDELDQLSRQLIKEPPITTLLEAARQIQRAPDLAIDALAADLVAQPHFAACYKRILDHIDPLGDAVITASSARLFIERQGISKTTTLWAAGRVAESLSPACVIDIEPLFTHAISVSLQAFETGRLLRLSNPHLLAASGLVHDIGKWLFAIGEPGLYAIALSLSQYDGASQEQGEVAIFGVDHQTAGKRLLELAGADQLLRDTASLHATPDSFETDNPEHAITLAVVHMANLFAHAAAAPTEALRQEIFKHFENKDHPVWQILHDRGVSIPLEEAELVATLASVAQTTHWISRELCSLRRR
jgi:CheY-like chemotaxis protein